MKSFQSISAILVLAIVFASCNNEGSKETTGTSDTSTTATTTVSDADANQDKLESNKKLVKGFVQELYGDRDTTAIDKYVADDVKQHNPMLQDGKEWLKNALHPFLSNPNAEKTKIDIKQIAAEGDKVWVFIRDVAPNGKVFARVEIFKIENGKIVENWLINQPEEKKSANKNSMF